MRATGHEQPFAKHPVIGSFIRIADLKQFLIEVGEIPCAPARLNGGNRLSIQPVDATHAVNRSAGVS
jgi:hypothetical protein